MSPTQGVAPPRVLFLFNHDAAHQAAHVAGVMAALALGSERCDVIAAVGTADIENTVRALVGGEAATKVRWERLALPRATAAALEIPNRVAPVLRIARLNAHTALFASVDLVVSPERTCLRVRRKLQRRMGSSAPRFVFIPHGAGDREVSYHPELGQFDWFLLSGQKVIDEMVDHGIARADQCRLIGYTKFDTISDNAPKRLFENDLPVIIYNPHFDPYLSSWYDHGPTILKAVATQPKRFNLVFAPHVMLFRKRLHVSPEHRRARWRPEIPRAALEAPNILIDTASPCLFDMSYTRAADIYLGDVSSQVYEFLRDPGACVFIDAARQGAQTYQFWQNGPVVQHANGALAALEDWRGLAQRYRPVQDRLFAYTIDTQPGRTASQRGAEALASILAA